jgi:hypothetical protein
MIWKTKKGSGPAGRSCLARRGNPQFVAGEGVFVRKTQTARLGGVAWWRSGPAPLKTRFLGPVGCVCGTWRSGFLGQKRGYLPPDRRRDFLYKQSQLPKAMARGQVLCGKRVMVNWTSHGHRQNKANCPKRGTEAVFRLRIGDCGPRSQPGVTTLRIGGLCKTNPICRGARSRPGGYLSPAKMRVRLPAACGQGAMGLGMGWENQAGNGRRGGILVFACCQGYNTRF